MNDIEIKTLWVYAREIWPLGFEIPADTRAVAVKLQVWRDILGDLDAGVVRRTLTQASRQTFPPPPGELRDRAVKLRAVESGEPVAPDIDQAWAEINRSFGSPGRNGTPSWSHPALAAAVNSIGWDTMCDTLTEDMGTLRAHFARYYDAATRRHTETAAPMPGLRRGLSTLELEA